MLLINPDLTKEVNKTFHRHFICISVGTLECLGSLLECPVKRTVGSERESHQRLILHHLAVRCSAARRVTSSYLTLAVCTSGPRIAPDRLCDILCPEVPYSMKCCAAKGISSNEAISGAVANEVCVHCGVHSADIHCIQSHPLNCTNNGFLSFVCLQSLGVTVIREACGLLVWFCTKSGFFLVIFWQ